jgi:hypothetical protein
MRDIIRYNLGGYGKYQVIRRNGEVSYIASGSEKE